MDRERTAAEGKPRLAPVVTVDDYATGTMIDAGRWGALAVGLLDALGVDERGELGVTFVDVDEMAELNLAHMGVEGPTDVLSFPIDGESLVGIDGSSHQLPDSPPVLLGDIVICPDVAAANAPQHAGSFEDEIALLLAHGILHLLGHDHAVDADREAMQARERELLATAYGPLAGDPWAS